MQWAYTQLIHAGHSVAVPAHNRSYVKLRVTRRVGRHSSPGSAGQQISTLSDTGSLVSIAFDRGKCRGTRRSTATYLARSGRTTILVKLALLRRIRG